MHICFFLFFFSNLTSLQPSEYNEVVEEPLETLNIRQVINEKALVSEGWDKLAQPIFWKQIMMLSPDSCLINIAKSRLIIAKVSKKDWNAQSNLEIDKYRDSVRSVHSLSSWIVECTGNTHFEGVMISFFFIALYFLLQQKIIIGSFFFAIAVQIKLIPLILLPFFFRYFGFWKSVKFYVITIAAVIAFGFIQLDSSNIENFGSSLRLYFKVFEFNSFVFYHYLQFGFWDTGYNMTKVYGPRLSYIAILLIFSIALIGDHFDWKKLFQRITIGFFIYLLLSNTMHPWYILPLLAFSLFSNFSFPVLWSFLIFFSYILYVYNDSSAIQVRIVSNIEYGLVISLFVYELWKKGTLFQFLNREMISNQQTEG